ncbi:MAG: hypothetical protein KF810_20390 [Rhizobiaceae bacterium]|nr:hypothetical protein [Rhizobiaceae bacterium]
MDRKYVLALLGGAALAFVGMVLLDDAQVGALLGGTIGAGFGFTFGLLRENT